MSANKIIALYKALTEAGISPDLATTIIVAKIAANDAS